MPDPNSLGFANPMPDPKVPREALGCQRVELAPCQDGTGDRFFSDLYFLLYLWCAGKWNRMTNVRLLIDSIPFSMEDEVST